MTKEQPTQKIEKSEIPGSNKKEVDGKWIRFFDWNLELAESVKAEGGKIMYEVVKMKKEPNDDSFEAPKTTIIGRFDSIEEAVKQCPELISEPGPSQPNYDSKRLVDRGEKLSGYAIKVQADNISDDRVEELVNAIAMYSKKEDAGIGYHEKKEIKGLNVPDTQKTNEEELIEESVIEERALKAEYDEVSCIYPDAFYLSAELGGSRDKIPYKVDTYGPFFDPEKAEKFRALIRDKYSEQTKAGAYIRVRSREGKSFIERKDVPEIITSLTLGPEEQREIKQILEKMEGGMRKTMRRALLQEIARKFGEEK